MRSETPTTDTASGVTLRGSEGSGSSARKYHPGLDGVRAFAIVLVLLYHLGLSRFTGGFLGVDVFFTLSGFLITTIVVDELSATGRLDFKNFYVRRARRLLPALLLVLFVTALLTLLFARDAAHQFALDSRAALLYVTNWWYVADAQDYFAVTGRPPLLQHLWSLAVEEQFYLVWPLIAFAAFRWGGRRRVALVAGVGALASTALMAAISIADGVPGSHDSGRVYFGTDTHASTLLVGAVLAMFWTPDRLGRRLTRRGSQALTGIGVVGALGLLACAVFASSESAWLFRGGFLVVGVLSVMIIAAAAVDETVFARALSWEPVRYIGTRSYGLYLWHWPIFQLTRPDRDIPFSGVTAMAISLLLTFAAAEISYRYVEMPIRRGALPGAIRRAREVAKENVRVAVVACVTAVALLVGLVVAVSSVPPPDSLEYVGGVTAVGAEPLEPAAGKPKAGTKGSTSKPAAVGTVTFVGDSVVLGARKALTRDIKGLVVDAAIARQPEDILARVEQRRKAGKLAPVVVVTAGANGYASRYDIAKMLRSLGDRKKVVLVTSAAPRSWVPKTNKNAKDAAKPYKNVVVLDWAKMAKGKRKYFYPDAIHLTTPGTAAFSAAVAKAARV